MDTQTQTILLITWVASVLAILFAFIWVAVRLGPRSRNQGAHGRPDDTFDDDFRAKLRERGVLRFERTLDQQAAFLQQDLRKISDEVAEHIKEQATGIIKEEFTDQKQSVAAAQQHITDAITQLDRMLSDYHKTLSEELHKELIAEKERRLERFTANMSAIITEHVQQTLGSHMQVGEQVQFILKNLEDNKTAIVEDIKREF